MLARNEKRGLLQPMEEVDDPNLRAMATSGPKRS
jgi:hypothetical protein